MDNLRKAILVRNGMAVGVVGDKYFSTCPIGVVQVFSGNTIPRGYLACDGQSYAVADYPHLYAVIGNTYGGDSTNFNVPDYRETVLVGVGENTTDTIADHDVYELGEFKDDQFQGHWHNLGSSDGVVTVSLGAGDKGGSINSAAPELSVKRYPVNTALDAITDGTNGEPRVGTTTHGKQKGVTYIIKAFHTNEGVDSTNEVSDPIIEYVEGEIATKKDAAKLLNNATDSTKWLKLKLGTSSTFQSIIVSDQYGGKVEINGMAEDGTYKSVKKIRYSYGNWTTYSATDYTLYDGVDPNYKIQRLFYYPTDGYYYLEIRQWATIKVEGNSTAELVASLPAEMSEMTLIPESNWGRIDDTSTGSTSSTWSSSKIKSEFNPTIDISKVFSNGALNIATLCSTYGNGRYVIVGQGTAGNGSATIDIWTLASHAISYIVNVTYSNKTSNTFIGLTYENPTINFEAGYLSACNHIAKVCTLA